MRIRSPLLFLLALAAPVAPAFADANLRGSHASMVHQHAVARDADLTFLRTPAQVREFVEKERLEQLTANADLDIANVSFPYTRPIVKTFIERLAAQYHAATGEKLVVTSLVRPTSRQPSNASPYSVHPAGIAVDFRVPSTTREREWFEATLLQLENSGVLDVTRERRPPHYHVAVFPDEYEAYVAVRLAEEAKTPVAETPATSVEPAIQTLSTGASVADSDSDSPSNSALLFSLLAGAALTLGAGGLVFRRA